MVGRMTCVGSPHKLGPPVARRQAAGTKTVKCPTSAAGYATGGTAGESAVAEVIG